MASILLIEDDPNIRFTIEMALNDEGYRVISCDNGADGLNAALNIHPDLILLDLLLPELDGRDLLVQFKKNNSTTPVLGLPATFPVFFSKRYARPPQSFRLYSDVATQREAVFLEKFPRTQSLVILATLIIYRTFIKSIIILNYF